MPLSVRQQRVFRIYSTLTHQTLQFRHEEEIFDFCGAQYMCCHTSVLYRSGVRVCGGGGDEQHFRFISKQRLQATFMCWRMFCVHYASMSVCCYFNFPYILLHFYYLVLWRLLSCLLLLIFQF